MYSELHTGMLYVQLDSRTIVLFEKHSTLNPHPGQQGNLPTQHYKAAVRHGHKVQGRQALQESWHIGSLLNYVINKNL
jgi:hypothetical protein